MIFNFYLQRLLGRQFLSIEVILELLKTTSSKQYSVNFHSLNFFCRRSEITLLKARKNESLRAALAGIPSET